MADKPFNVRVLSLTKAIVTVAYVVLVISVVILTIAFFLRLLGASTTAEFTQWIYRSANRIMAPFRGIFPPIEGDNGSVLDLALLFAMVMYGLLALAVEWVAEWLGRRIRAETLKSAAQAAAVPPAAGTYGTERSY
jgi:uncharacterized protein YggT (Ycf19 family)